MQGTSCKNPQTKSHGLDSREKKNGERGEKTLKSKARAGKAESKDGPYSWQWEKPPGSKNEGKIWLACPSWQLRSWGASPLAGPPLFVFFTAHYFSCSHITAPGTVLPRTRAQRSDRVPLAPMAPGNTTESTGQRGYAPSSPHSRPPGSWLRSFQWSVPWRLHSQPLHFKSGWNPNRWSQSEICMASQV